MFRLTYKRAVIGVCVCVLMYEARLAGNIFNRDITDDDYVIGEPQHAA
jgi:hypothetical protein